MRVSHLFIGLLCLSVPAASLACIAGTTYTKTVGEFSATMSYDAYSIRPGQTVRFHFDLNNISHRSYGTGNPIDYDYVEATFRRGNDVLFVQSVDRIDYGETAFDYELPAKNADYVMGIRFVRKGEEIAALSLPVRVGWGNLWKRMYTLGRMNAALLDGVTVTVQDGRVKT